MNKFTGLLFLVFFIILGLVNGQQFRPLELDFGNVNASQITIESSSSYDPIPSSASVLYVNYTLNYVKTEGSTALCTFSFVGIDESVSLDISETSVSGAFEGDFSTYPFGTQLSSSINCDEQADIGLVSLEINYEIGCNAENGTIYDGYCVCHSSFGGVECSEALVGECPIEEPSRTSTVNPPSLVESLSFSNNELTLVARHGFVDTRKTKKITIGTSTSQYCQHPGPFWSSSVDQCNDVFSSSIPWSIASSECDLARTVETEYIVYKGNLLVHQTEDVGEIRGTPITRDIQSSLGFQIRFPTQVVVDLQSLIYDEINVVEALNEQNFDPDTRTGSIKFVTSVQNPFALSYSSHEIVTNGDLAGVVSLDTENSACTGVEEEGCLQHWNIEVTPGGTTCTMNGVYNTTFTFYCNGDPSNCPLDGGETGFVALEITSNDFCATVSDDVDVSGSMTTTDKDAYFTGEVASLRATVTSNDATLTNVQLVSVSTKWNEQNTLIYDGGVTSTDVDFTVVSESANTAEFTFLLDSQVYPVVEDGSGNMAVTAVLSVTFENTNKREIITRQMRFTTEDGRMETGVETNFIYGPRKGDENNSGSGEDRENDASLNSYSSMMTLLFGVVTLLFSLL